MKIRPLLILKVSSSNIDCGSFLIFLANVNVSVVVIMIDDIAGWTTDLFGVFILAGDKMHLF